MKPSKVLFVVTVLGALAMGLSFGTFRDGDSGDSDGDGDGDSAFAFIRGAPAPTAIQIQFRLIQS